MKQVDANLGHVLQGDIGPLREKVPVVKELKKELDRLGREMVVDKPAYTWFNRLTALRYMDARGFQPLEVSVLSPVEGQVSPQLLQEAMGGISPTI